MLMLPVLLVAGAADDASGDDAATDDSDDGDVDDSDGDDAADDGEEEDDDDSSNKQPPEPDSDYQGPYSTRSSSGCLQELADCARRAPHFATRACLSWLRV